VVILKFANHISRVL